MNAPVIAPVVPWAVGPKLAIARAVALLLCAERGRAWDRLKPSVREAFLSEAVAVVEGWARDGIVAVFDHEWREPVPKG